MSLVYTPWVQDEKNCLSLNVFGDETNLSRSEEDDVSDVDSDVDSTGNAGTLHKSPKSPATNGNNIK